MAPHATSTSPDRADTRLATTDHDVYNGSSITNNNHDNIRTSDPSSLTRYPDDEVHDMICVGFGPASLAIAVALQDALEPLSTQPGTAKPKVRFLERQPHFAWHAGMMLPGAKMQISFIKDLATLRNPRSKFTFMNYLHEKRRLVSFSNLGTFLPERMEYEDYMRWCAGHFEDVVDYDTTVTSIKPAKLSTGTKVECFQVESWNRRREEFVLLRARHVVIAVGGRPNIPKCLSIDSPRVIHSSTYATQASNMFSPDSPPKSIAVIGGGQSAAEVFHNIHSRFPSSKSYLIVRDSALRPSDDSPFVNEIFDPEKVDSIYAQDSAVRANSLAADKATNYGVVRLELLEKLYSEQYSYRLQYERETDWPQQILTHRNATGITVLPAADSHALRLHLSNTKQLTNEQTTPRDEALDVDLVVVASGYARDAHTGLMRGLEHLMPEREDADGSWKVCRNYAVQFKKDSVRDNAGIWLQGSNENTHGLSDTLLSILATRGGEVVQSILGLG